MNEEVFDYTAHFNTQGIRDPEVIDALAVLHRHWLAYREKWPGLTMRQYLNRVAAAADRAPVDAGEREDQ